MCNYPPPPKQTHTAVTAAPKNVHVSARPCAITHVPRRSKPTSAQNGRSPELCNPPPPTPPSLGAGAKLRVPPPRALYAHAGLRSRNPPRVRVCAGAPIIAVIFLSMGVRGGDSAQPGSSHL